MWLLELNGISEFGRCGFCFSRALIRKHFPLPPICQSQSRTGPPRCSRAPLAGKRCRVLHFERHQTREDGFSYLWLPNFLNWSDSTGLHLVQIRKKTSRDWDRSTFQKQAQLTSPYMLPCMRASVSYNC